MQILVHRVCIYANTLLLIVSFTTILKVNYKRIKKNTCEAIGSGILFCKKKRRGIKSGEKKSSYAYWIVYFLSPRSHKSKALRQPKFGFCVDCNEGQESFHKLFLFLSFFSFINFIVFFTLKNDLIFFLTC